MFPGTFSYATGKWQSGKFIADTYAGERLDDLKDGQGAALTPLTHGTHMSMAAHVGRPRCRREPPCSLEEQWRPRAGVQQAAAPPSPAVPRGGGHDGGYDPFHPNQGPKAARRRRYDRFARFGGVSAHTTATLADPGRCRASMTR